MDQSFLLNTLLILGRLLVGGILVLAGVLKLKAGSRWFLGQILAYELVKGKTALLLAKGLPWAEIICGVWLMIGFLTPLASLISFILLWGFTAAVVSTFLRGKRVDCGCFGQQINPQTNRTRWTVAYRNLGLMGILLLIHIADTIPLSIDQWLNEQSYFIGYVGSVARPLTVIWSCSLVLAVSLQWFVQKRVYSNHKTYQAKPPIQQNN